MQSDTFLQGLFGLDGKVALVTGASGGIGSGLARGLALAGATVALNGRSPERLAEARDTILAQGGHAEVFPADLGDLAAVSRLVDSVVDRYGGLDILVNCAGVNKREPIVEVTPETFERITNLNLRAAYFLSQAALPKLVERGGGKIVHIGSLNAAFGLGTISVYGLTKGAMAQMTKVQAVEWARHNVQVNCLCPGFIETELTAPLWADEAKRRWLLDRVPANRPGLPADLVGMCLYLASTASAFTTGQAIYVDGGFTAGGQW
ncbi:MAG TPA: glucose 1-dehydrogenase [Chloroflexota bacterium]|nr:glucose 1-dehydrogenase [Chloroflexota bacterium]